jgi:hypothetical protein
MSFVPGDPTLTGMVAVKLRQQLRHARESPRPAFHRGSPRAGSRAMIPNHPNRSIFVWTLPRFQRESKTYLREGSVWSARHLH